MLKNKKLYLVVLFALITLTFAMLGFKVNNEHTHVDGTSLEKVICPICYGAQTVTCPTCNGTGTYTCDNCHGTGKTNELETCTYCDVNGYPMGTEYIACDMCDGTGWDDCLEECCNECNGRGFFTLVTCTQCGGAGVYGVDELECTECESSGKVIGYVAKCTVCGGEKTYSKTCTECTNGEKTCTCDEGEVNCSLCSGLGTIDHVPSITIRHACENEDCVNGKELCSYCDGTKICFMCEGSGNCHICGGEDPSCSCSGTNNCIDCGGNGICSNCDENGLTNCDDCDGLGYTEENIYAVYYNLNGGTGVAPIDINYYSQGDNVPVMSTTLTRKGYTFVGWNTSSTATTGLSSYTMGNAAVTFYAIWDPITHTCNNITFDKPLTSESSISDLLSGNYYLFEDIQFSQNVQILLDQNINLCLNGHSLDLNSNHITMNANTTLNIYDCDSSLIHYFDVDQNNVWTLAADQSVVTSNYCYGGVITGGNATSGGAIYVSSDAVLNVYGGNFIGNSASGNGGVILNDNKTLLKNCYIAHNNANIGGAVYNEDSTRLTIVNSTIEYNSATTTAGGIYSYYTGCLVEGTLVTMADGSTKKIEDVVEGDMIRTFDHETGKLSSEEVCLAYTNGKSKSFTLSFTNNIELSIVDCHDLFEQSSLKYVTINEGNVKDYIGKYFYNANANRWEKLLSVSYNNELSNYYSLYTARHNNSIANDMLTLPDDMDYLFNIFEFDENLKINQAQKQADINQYGLYPYSIAKDYMSEEYYDAFNAKYLYIAMGKGLVSYEYARQLNSDTREYIDEKNQSTQRRLSSLFSSKTNMRKNTIQNEITALTYTGSVGGTSIILGSNAVITNNKVGTSDSNIYLDGDSAKIYIVKDATGIQAGVSMSTIGTFASQMVDETSTLNAINSSNTFFTSDNTTYAYNCKKYGSDATYYSCNIESKYGVTYDSNAGSDTVTNMPSADTNKYFVDDPVSIPSGTPVRAEYKFLGWATTSAGTVITTSTTPMVANGITLYAIWEEKVEIDMDVYPQKIFYDGTAKTPALNDEEGEALSITGFSFAYEKVIEGGYEACSEAKTPCQYRVHITRAEDDDYKAFDAYVLMVITYTVTYKANTGVGDDIVDESDDSINHYFYGDYDLFGSIKALIKTNTFTKENYSFAFWNTSADGKGTTYNVNREYELEDNLVLYACYSANVSIQPNKDNDYAVECSTTDTVTYQWEKGTYQTISVALKDDVLTGTYDSTLGTITSSSKQIVIKAHDLNTLLKFTCDATLSDGVTPVGNTYTYNVIRLKGLYYVINGSEEFTISNIEFYELKFDAITGETSNTISSATEDAKYRCAITSIFNGVSYSNEIVPKHISFIPGADAFSSVASIDMYQLENRIITIPANVFYREDYKFTTWDDGVATYDVDETYTVGSTDVIFTAQWEEKSVATDNSTNTSFDYDGKNHATLAEIEACISIVDENEKELTPTTKYYSFDGVNYFDYTIVIWSNYTFKNADEYTIYYRCEFEDYKTVKGSFTMTINKVKVTVPSAITGLSYNTKEQTGVATSTLYSITNNKKTEVGSYDAVATLLDKTNYLWNLTTPTVDDQTITWSIAKCKVSVPTQSNTLTYNGTMQSPTWDDTSLVICSSLSDLEAILPNTYLVNFVLMDTTSYEWTDGTIEEKETSWTLNKKDVTITANNQSIVYGETISSTVANVTVNGLVEGDEVSSITLTTTNVDVTTSGVITASAATIYKDDVDYTCFYNITYAPGVLTITKGQAVITIDTTAIVITYGDTLTLPTYSNNFGTVEVDKTVANLVNVGTYTVNYTIDGTDNYNGDTKSVSVTINPYKVTKPSANETTFTYTGSLQTYTLTTSTLYAITNNTRTDVGSQTVTVALNDKANYVWDETTPSTTDLEFTFTINKGAAVITVNQTAIVKTYGQTVTIPTATTNFGKVVCDKVSANLVNAGTYTITYTVEGTTNYDGDTKTVSVTINKAKVNEPKVSGTYTYTGKAQTVKLTGTATYMTTTSTLTQTNAGTYTITYTLDDNHEWNTNNDGEVSWTIAVANNPISVDQTAIVKTYAEELVLPTATSKFGTVVCDTVVANLVNVGTYTVTYTVEGTDNYNGDSKTVSVTINPLELDLVLSNENDIVVTYGDTITDPTTTTTNPSYDSYIKFTKKYYRIIDFANEVVEEVNEMVNAGEYAIIYFAASQSDNIDLSTKKVVFVTINKMKVQEPKLVNEYTYTGKAQTASLTGVESYMSTTSELTKTNVGTYTITYTLDNNHEWDKNNDGEIIWKINKANAVIDINAGTIFKTYGETVVLPEYSTNFGSVVVDKTVADLVNAGTYTVTYSVEGTDNYNGDTKSITVIISKAASKITVDQTEIIKTYGEEFVLPTASATFGNVVVDKTIADLVNVGSYVVTYKVEDTDNFTGDSKTINVTINKANASITVGPKAITKVYGQTVTLPVGSSNFGTVVCDKTVADLVNVGTYTVTYTVEGTDNYNGDSKTITVKINKAKVAEPKVVNAYKYTGNAQTVELTGVESFMTTTDSLTQINAGVYTITYQLDNNHEWDKNSDGVITWEIKEIVITPVVDPTEPEKKQEVVVESEEGFSNDITIEVEVTVEAEVETKELTVDYYNITEETAKLAEDEKVSLVFDVKLIQTINGVKKEIQPEDIAPGTKIKVKMLIPETVDVTKVTRILHVHSANDIESINFDASKMDENRYYEIEVDRLSEFAYIYQVEKEAFPVWAIVLIVIAGILLIFIGFFFIWKVEFDSATKKELEYKEKGEEKSISRKLKFLDPIYRPINKLFFGGKKKDKEEK